MPAIVLGWLTMTESATLGLVIALSVVNGLVDAVNKPARLSFPSELVARAHLSNAIMLSNVVLNCGKAVGPAVAGILISTVGIPFTFWANAATFGAVIIALLLMDPQAIEAGRATPRTKGQIREGLRYVKSDPALLGPVACLAVVGILAYNFSVMLPLLGREAFDGDAHVAGSLLAALGLGAVIGGLAFAGVLQPTTRRIVLSSAALELVIVLTGASPTYHVALALVFAMGATSVVFKSLTSTWLQLAAEPQMRGRIAALVVICVAGSSPIGAPLTGWPTSSACERPMRSPAPAPWWLPL